jgi:hypothetical protein
MAASSIDVGSQRITGFCCRPGALSICFNPPTMPPT